MPVKRLSWRSRKRRRSREEREVIGPRREREGRESETTRLAEGEQTTPIQLAAQASGPVQLERR